MDMGYDFYLWEKMKLVFLNQILTTLEGAWAAVIGKNQADLA